MKLFNMSFFRIAKDGGPESPVTGLYIIEIKSLFSIAILKFNKGMREAFHSHAFNALSWFIKGETVEHFVDGPTKVRKGLCLPHYTPRTRVHKYSAHKTAYCLTIRGPWSDTWYEYEPTTKLYTTLTQGRKVVKQGKTLES